MIFTKLGLVMLLCKDNFPSLKKKCSTLNLKVGICYNIMKTKKTFWGD